MRNLRNIRHEICKTSAAITSACWDAGKDEILVTFGPTETDSQIQLARVVDGTSSSSSSLVCQKVASWDAPCPNPDLVADKVVDIHHFSDNLTTCLVLAGGDIVVVQEEEGLNASDGVHIEIVGSIDSGIRAARWAPDEELLAITTNANTVVFMSRSFDGVAEAVMTLDDLKVSKHVSVGWGKKETQFKGKGAKALRDPTIPEKVDEGVLSPNDDGRTTISWRGDGAFVAVNSIDKGSRRVIRVYSREAVLDSVSEPVDGLEGSLSWRPAGNLIAGIQRFSDHIDVVFFERNGLRHGQFTLRGPFARQDASKSISLEWNSESTVLAVIHESVIQLWTMGNYHWYLKQELLTGPQCSVARWHPEKPLRLTAAASDTLISVDYIFDVARGSLAPPHDYGAVAVIDGQSVKLTPFRTVNIPPPMAMYEVSSDSSVVDVAFSPDNAFMGVLHHAGFDIFSWQTKGGRSLAPFLVGKIEFTPGKASRYDDAAIQLSYSGENEVHVLHHQEDLVLSSYQFDPAIGEVKLVASKTVKPDTILVASNPSYSLHVQVHSGRVSQLSEQQHAPTIKFPTQMPWVEAVTHEEDSLICGLSRSGHLYANERLLMKNCTSFLVTPAHIVLTTSNHLLKFIHISHSDALEVPGDDPEVDERCRSIERGARLVTAVPSNMNVILQMPRGNLETIFPRAMVVGGIRRLIDEKDYCRAFSYCRTQRVDMNILYDHKPGQFLANVGLFLQQLKDVSHIDLFLSSLREEDVTQTMYKDTKPSRTQGLPAAGEQNDALSSMRAPSSKVNTICDAVLRSLQTQKNVNLQNIITAHVCKIPPALDDGLLVVAGLLQEDESLAERAVEHICFLVDVNKLYDNALGLYNLDLTLLVAQQSQRDPREYLPFVQSLHKMPFLRRKFSIDDHLGHREKALGHLRALNVFDEVRDYTVKHSLYQTALGLYRYDEAHHRTLTELFASHLESKSQFREAGLAYESLGAYPLATSCYQSAGPTSWRECLSSALSQHHPPLAPTALADLATTLADALTEAKDYLSAATIHADHLSAPAAAIRLLARGYHFAEALRLIAMRQTPDLLAVFDNALLDALSSSTDLLADCKAQLGAQVPRVLELRRKAREDPLAFYEGERAGGGDVPDDVSVAASSRMSTSASLFTRYTGKGGSTGSSVGTAATGSTRAAAKRGRREEKKRARGRKGTVYEEEYLVNSVRRLVGRVESAGAEVERLVFALVRRGMAERARAVEGLMGEVVEGCKKAVGEIWLPVVVGGDEAQGSAVGEGLPGVRTGEDPPVVKDFGRLSLLGG